MKWLATLLIVLCLTPFAFAFDFDGELSEEDKEAFDNILEPVMKVYQFVKYALTILAVLFLLFAAGTFIVSGKDHAKRESAKTMMIYVVVGLIIIWVAPLIVGFFAS